MSRSARLFQMNFGTWRDRPSISERQTPAELNELDQDLPQLADHPTSGHAITCKLRQIVLQRPDTM